MNETRNTQDSVDESVDPVDESVDSVDEPVDSVDEPVDLGPSCPSCHEPWLRPAQLPGSYRCVYCLVRFQLMSHCPRCGEHSTIVRMSDSANLNCVSCGGSMLKPI